MALRKPKSNIEKIIKHNDSNSRNFTHQFESDNVSYILPNITLEDLDLLILNYFDNFFYINNKPLRLINGMISPESVKFIYPDLYNNEKETLISPYLVYKRSNTERHTRNNPSYKPITYVVPKMKPQGLVYEEYTTEPPIHYNLTYEFIFITSFYDNINDLTQQVSYFFKNKRNMIELNKEKFTIKPANGLNELFQIDNVNEENAQINTQYSLTFSLILEAYTRDNSKTIKRERPNRYTIDYKVKDKDDKIISTDRTEISLDKENKKGTN